LTTDAESAMELAVFSQEWT